MWLTISETADYLKVSKETVYKLAQKSQIPSGKVGSQWRFNKAALDNWILQESGENKSRDKKEEQSNG